MTNEELLKDLAANYVHHAMLDPKLKSLEEKTDKMTELLKALDEKLNLVRNILNHVVIKNKSMVVKNMLSDKQDILIVDLKDS